LIAVVDYGAGNLHSVCNALDLFGTEYKIAKLPADMAGADGILLPGVGHFGQMLHSLGESQMTERLVAEAAEGAPLLGICLGMQALFESSEEAPDVRGLGLLTGQIKRFAGVPKVPHMGWNDVVLKSGGNVVVYFANSFYAPVGFFTTGICEYGVPFSAMVKRANVAGVQFHPEKSGEAGLELLWEWCRSC